MELGLLSQNLSVVKLIYPNVMLSVSNWTGRSVVTPPSKVSFVHIFQWISIVLQTSLMCLVIDFMKLSGRNSGPRRYVGCENHKATILEINGKVI